VSLLIPDLERQLREVVRGRQLATAPGRRPRGVVFALVGVLPAVAIAVLALVLLGHGSRSRLVTASAPHPIAGQITKEETCRERPGSLLMSASKAALGSAVATVSVATGSLGGYKWDLRAKTGENGFDAIENGRLVLDGHTYGMCGGFPNPAEFALIDTGSHGIVYGYLANPGRWAITFRSALDGGVGQFSVLYTRRVLGGTFFISSVPQPACADKSLTLLASREAAVVEPGSFGDIHYLTFGGCQPNQARRITGGDGAWSLSGLIRPSGLSGPSGLIRPSQTSIVARIALHSATSNGKASGTVDELEQGGGYGVTISASGLAKNRKRNAYAVWLDQSPSKSRLLGFVSPPVRANGQLHTGGGLPPNASIYHEILITLETSTRPRDPGKVVLIGHGHFR
jgi:hypothetical protein